MWLLKKRKKEVRHQSRYWSVLSGECHGHLDFISRRYTYNRWAVTHLQITSYSINTAAPDAEITRELQTTDLFFTRNYKRASDNRSSLHQKLQESFRQQILTSQKLQEASDNRSSLNFTMGNFVACCRSFWCKAKNPDVRITLPLVCFVWQIAMIILFGLFVRYNEESDAHWSEHKHKKNITSDIENDFYYRYPSEFSTSAGIDADRAIN